MSQDDFSAGKQDLELAVITMAVESWRFGKTFDRLMKKLDAGEDSRYRSQFRWFLKKVEDGLGQAGLKLVAYPAIAINIKIS